MFFEINEFNDMTICKIKQPVEYSFIQWINNYPDSGHWADKERFFRFVKTVCRYNASRWKKTDFLKNKILEAKPHFDPEFLNRLLYLYDNLIEFHKTSACTTPRLVDKLAKEGHYIELRVKKGNIYEVELPLT